MSQPRVAVIGTGGTFAMQGRHAFDWVEYGESGVVRPVAELIGAARDWNLAEIVPIDFRQLGSTGITPADWLELGRVVRDVLNSSDGPDGCVITHGTATLEETAFFLHAVYDGTAPIVLTGAQRPPNTSGSDAPANLRAAIAVAASPAARGLGVLVVIDNLIFSAGDVTKTSSGALDAFEAPEFGPLGRIEADGRIVLRRAPLRAIDTMQLGEALDVMGPLPRVDIVCSYAGADDVAIDAFVAAGARGIVRAGLWPGRPAKAAQGALARAAAAGILVVQATRGVRGNVVPQAFLDRAGVLPGGDLAPVKLRILMMLALALGADHSAIGQTLASWSGIRSSGT